ncbi:MAG: hypothetical protein EOO00_14915, partial [Chitinophagaceae bacterium]
MEELPLNGRFRRAVQEIGNHYYLIAEIYGGAESPVVHQKPTMFELCKYNKQNNTLVASTIIAGDTLQQDSLQIGYSVMYSLGSKLYIQYSKYEIMGTDVHLPSYYQQYDTMLNLTIPEKKLSGMGEGVWALGGTTPLDNGGLMIAYFTAITPPFTSKYLILDDQGNEIANDTLGYPPHIFQNTAKEILRLPNNRYLVTGNHIGGDGPFNEPFGWSIVDEHMNIIEMIWPITCFLVIVSIIVHGSSIAVFTLGKRINTLTISLSYTQANEDGPGWMD